MEYYGDMKPGLGDSGGASRFFYCAKTSRREREAGLNDIPVQKANKMGSFGDQSDYGRHGDKGTTLLRNLHPTVKPIALFEWLIKLVTRQGQIILDPFLGSGTTMIAAHKAGRKCIGIEKEWEYLGIAKRRVAFWQVQPVQLGMEKEA